MIIFKEWLISLEGAAPLVFKPSRIAVALALLLLFQASAVEAPRLKFDLSPSSIEPGQHAKLEIRIPWEGLPNLEESPPVVRDDLLTQAQGLQLLDKTYRREGKDLVWTYELTSYQEATLTVPPIEIQIGAMSFSTEARPLTVSIASRPAEDFQVREEYGPIPLKKPWLKWTLWALGALLAGVGVAYALRYSKLKPKNARLPKPEAVPEENPLEWLRRELERLEKAIAALENGGVDELSEILRKYYAKVSKNPVETWTTGEFRRKFSRDEKAQKIVLIFERCDHFKFSGSRNESPARLTVECLKESERILFPWAS